MVSLISQIRINTFSKFSQSSISSFNSNNFKSSFKYRHHLVRNNHLSQPQLFLKPPPNTFIPNNQYSYKRFKTLYTFRSTSIKNKPTRKIFSCASLHTRNYSNIRLNSILNKIDSIKPNNLAIGIIFINVVIFVIVKSIYLCNDDTLIPRDIMKTWIDQNMTTNESNLQQGRIWTLFTSSFTHFGFWHLLCNTVTLYYFAPVVAASLGNRRFLLFYFISSLTSQFSFVIYDVYNKLMSKLVGKPDPSEEDFERSFGASGNAIAICTYFCYKFPKEVIHFFFFLSPLLCFRLC